MILVAVLNFGSNIINEKKIIYSHSELKIRIKEKNNLLNDDNIDEFINSLVRNRYLFYPGHKYPKLAGFYIVHIDKFTEYLYQILSKEWAYNDPDMGYFLKAEGIKRIQNATEEEKEFVIQFLLDTEIIFEVQNSEDKNPRYVAPSYLPEPEPGIEKLFIDSFEDPDCKFEFHEFFHSNVIHQVFKKYQKFILKDYKSNNNNENVRYLIWKNCIIIYNSISSEKEIKGSKPKDFLKLELLLPNKENQERIPTFTIARNNAGKVENDQFAKVFSEIKDLLNKYSPKILVKTPYTNIEGESEYIDFKDVEAADMLTERGNKISGFIASGNVLYYKNDFRHFYQGMKAPLKIFIAYSKFDDLYRLELKDHLQPGINEGKFIVFDDRGIEMGEKWLARIKKELEQCDVFILLISVKLLSTDFVINTEIPKARERMEKSKLEIFPIMLSPCDWTKTKLLDINAFDKLQPISLFNSKGDLSINERAGKWQEIVKILENLKPSKSNGLNPTNGSASSDESIPGTDKENDGEQ